MIRRATNSLDKKINMTKVNLPSLKPWITKKLVGYTGSEDDVLIEFIFSQLEEKTPDPALIQQNMAGFISAKNARNFVQELWGLLDIASESQDGIPPQVIGLKVEDTRQTYMELQPSENMFLKQMQIKNLISKIISKDENIGQAVSGTTVLSGGPNPDATVHYTVTQLTTTTTSQLLAPKSIDTHHRNEVDLNMVTTSEYYPGPQATLYQAQFSNTIATGKQMDNSSSNHLNQSMELSPGGQEFSQNLTPPNPSQFNQYTQQHQSVSTHNQQQMLFRNNKITLLPDPFNKNPPSNQFNQSEYGQLILVNPNQPVNRSEHNSTAQGDLHKKNPLAASNETMTYQHTTDSPKTTITIPKIGDAPTMSITTVMTTPLLTVTQLTKTTTWSEERGEANGSKKSLPFEPVKSTEVIDIYKPPLTVPKIFPGRDPFGRNVFKARYSSSSESGSLSRSRYRRRMSSRSRHRIRSRHRGRSGSISRSRSRPRMRSRSASFIRARRKRFRSRSISSKSRSSYSSSRSNSPNWKKSRSPQSKNTRKEHRRSASLRHRRKRSPSYVPYEYDATAYRSQIPTYAYAYQQPGVGMPLTSSHLAYYPSVSSPPHQPHSHSRRQKVKPYTSFVEKESPPPLPFYAARYEETYREVPVPFLDIYANQNDPYSLQQKASLDLYPLKTKSNHNLTTDYPVENFKKRTYKTQKNGEPAPSKRRNYRGVKRSKSRSNRMSLDSSESRSLTGSHSGLESLSKSGSEPQPKDRSHSSVKSISSRSKSETGQSVKSGSNSRSNSYSRSQSLTGSHRSPQSRSMRSYDSGEILNKDGNVSDDNLKASGYNSSESDLTTGPPRLVQNMLEPASTQCQRRSREHASNNWSKRRRNSKQISRSSYSKKLKSRSNSVKNRSSKSRSIEYGQHGGSRSVSSEGNLFDEAIVSSKYTSHRDSIKTEKKSKKLSNKQDLNGNKPRSITQESDQSDDVIVKKEKFISEQGSKKYSPRTKEDNNFYSSYDVVKIKTLIDKKVNSSLADKTICKTPINKKVDSSMVDTVMSTKFLSSDTGPIENSEKYLDQSVAIKNKLNQSDISSSKSSQSEIVNKNAEIKPKAFTSMAFKTKSSVPIKTKISCFAMDKQSSSEHETVAASTIIKKESIRLNVTDIATNQKLDAQARQLKQSQQSSSRIEQTHSTDAMNSKSKKTVTKSGLKSLQCWTESENYSSSQSESGSDIESNRHSKSKSDSGESSESDGSGDGDEQPHLSTRATTESAQRNSFSSRGCEDEERSGSKGGAQLTDEGLGAGHESETFDWSPSDDMPPQAQKINRDTKESRSNDERNIDSSRRHFTNDLSADEGLRTNDVSANDVAADKVWRTNNDASDVVRRINVIGANKVECSENVSADEMRWKASQSRSSSSVELSKVDFSPKIDSNVKTNKCLNGSPSSLSRNEERGKLKDNVSAAKEKRIVKRKVSAEVDSGKKKMKKVVTSSDEDDSESSTSLSDPDDISANHETTSNKNKDGGRRLKEGRTKKMNQSDSSNRSEETEDVRTRKTKKQPLKVSKDRGDKNKIRKKAGAKLKRKETSSSSGSSSSGSHSSPSPSVSTKKNKNKKNQASVVASTKLARQKQVAKEESSSSDSSSSSVQADKRVTAPKKNKVSVKKSKNNKQIERDTSGSDTSSEASQPILAKKKKGKTTRSKPKKKNNRKRDVTSSNCSSDVSDDEDCVDMTTKRKSRKKRSVNGSDYEGSQKSPSSSSSDSFRSQMATGSHRRRKRQPSSSYSSSSSYSVSRSLSRRKHRRSSRTDRRGHSRMAYSHRHMTRSEERHAVHSRKHRRVSRARYRESSRRRYEDERARRKYEEERARRKYEESSRRRRHGSPHTRNQLYSSSQSSDSN